MPAYCCCCFHTEGMRRIMRRLPTLQLDSCTERSFPEDALPGGKQGIHRLLRGKEHGGFHKFCVISEQEMVITIVLLRPILMLIQSIQSTADQTKIIQRLEYGVVAGFNRLNPGARGGHCMLQGQRRLRGTLGSTKIQLRYR